MQHCFALKLQKCSEFCPLNSSCLKRDSLCKAEALTAVFEHVQVISL